MRKTVFMFNISSFLITLLFNTDCVINGESAQRNEFAATVRIIFKSGNNTGQPLCTGVILNEILVLTAGHCLKDVQDLKNIEVIAGDHHRITIEDTEQSRQVVENYDHDLMDYEHARRYDLTILRLDSPLIFGESVISATLPKKGYDAKEAELTFSGFGVIKKPEPSGPFKFTDILQKVILEVIDTKTCEQEYFDTDSNEDFSGALCGFNDNATPSLGDSGGGAFYLTGNEKVLAGILSYSAASALVVFTRVDEMVVAWIEEIANTTYHYLNLRKTEVKNSKSNKAINIYFLLEIVGTLIVLGCLILVYSQWKYLCSHRNTDIENELNLAEGDELIKLQITT